LAKAKVMAEIPKNKSDEPEYFINLGHFESKITFYSARKPQWLLQRRYPRWLAGSLTPIAKVAATLSILTNR
jgi:hypothetical protein